MRKSTYTHDWDASQVLCANFYVEGWKVCIAQYLKAEKTSVGNLWELSREQKASSKALSCLETQWEVVMGPKVVDLVESDKG